MLYLCPLVNIIILRFTTAIFFILPVLSIMNTVAAQTLILPDADSAYITGFVRPNDIRISYGGEGTSLAYGSMRNSDKQLNTAIYNNASDLLGVGITYKIIDGDLAFSLPNTRLMNDDRKNLEQFRFGFGYTGRQYAIRGFLLDGKGMISEDVSREFKSEPAVRLFKIGAQFTYYFNEQRYSFRAANFQSEWQHKTAGSFLLRFEPSFRQLEADSELVPEPRDVVSVYGDQAGLRKVKSPGLLVMPGYGVNIVAWQGRFFFSPYMMAGPGLAVNTYKSDVGIRSSVNWEWSAMITMNTGYNGDRFYACLRLNADVYYIPLNPTFFTTTSLKVGLTVGYRLRNMEKFIPTTFF